MEEVSRDDCPPCLIYIDKEGNWYHKGAPMIHKGFVELFYENMTLDDQGRYIIEMDGQRCYVDVEDTAYVVKGVTYFKEESGERFILHLSDNSQEELDPETLYIGEGDVLYCMVKRRAFPARFTRPAYYQLAEFIVEKHGDFFLPLNGKQYQIKPKTEE